MSFRSLARDIRDSIGSLSRRSFEVVLNGHNRGKSRCAVHELSEQPVVIQTSCWANLPPELLFDVIKRLEENESMWPARKHVIACGAVCQSWRDMCREIVQGPEFCGKITFPVSLKQPGFRKGTIQCFIKRDKCNLTYHLFLSLNPAQLTENGKFLLSAKRNRRASCTEYLISMNADNISSSSSTYIGKVRSNFLGTKFVIYDTQSSHNNISRISPCCRTSFRFNSNKISPKVPSRSYRIAQVRYEFNVIGTRGPRRMQCVMHSIPSSALEPGGHVPGQPELLPCSLGDSFRNNTLGDSFRSSSFSKSIGRSTDFSSARFSDITGQYEEDEGRKDQPLVLKNKQPRWHEQLHCWCLNFKGRVTIASVKNFQLIAAAAPRPDAAAATTSSSQINPPDHDKVILQFGKVENDIFTMDYRYPLSAFQAFAICLSSFDSKLACE